MKPFCEFCGTEDVFIAPQYTKSSRYWWTYCNKCGIEVCWENDVNTSEMRWIGDLNMNKITLKQAQEIGERKKNAIGI